VAGEAAAVPSASAVWLRGHLMELAVSCYPGRRPAVIDEWTDPSQLRDGDMPAGHRHLAMVAVERGDPAGFGPVIDAFGRNGWRVPPPRQSGGEGWSRATRDSFTVRLYQGAGPSGVVMFTGWTPVVYSVSERSQPMHTISTVSGGVLCRDCEGLGLCIECEGTGAYRRCGWCYAANKGRGNCPTCGCGGNLAAEHMPSWEIGAYRGLDEHGGPLDPPGPQEPPGMAKTNLNALARAVRLPCGHCGETRCMLRNTVVPADVGVTSCYFGQCPRCGGRRRHEYRLPYIPRGAPEG
jgi:hypothetical protein